MSAPWRICLAALLLILAAVAAAAPPWTAKRWEHQVRAYEIQDRDNFPAPCGVLFIGSSSIRLWKNLAQDFPGINVINRGFGGAQIADVTFYADRLILPYRPCQIIFYAGENDLADGHTPDDIAESFLSFVERVRQDLPEVSIAFLSIKPSPAREHLLENTRAANDLVRRTTSTIEGLSYIDVFPHMLAPDGRVRTELMEDDGLHISRRGYQVWRTIIAEHLGNLLATNGSGLRNGVRESQ